MRLCHAYRRSQGSSCQGYRSLQEVSLFLYVTSHPFVESGTDTVVRFTCSAWFRTSIVSFSNCLFLSLAVPLSCHDTPSVASSRAVTSFCTLSCRIAKVCPNFTKVTIPFPLFLSSTVNHTQLRLALSSLHETSEFQVEMVLRFLARKHSSPFSLFPLRSWNSSPIFPLLPPSFSLPLFTSSYQLKLHFLLSACSNQYYIVSLFLSLSFLDESNWFFATSSLDCSRSHSHSHQ